MATGPIRDDVALQEVADGPALARAAADAVARAAREAIAARGAFTLALSGGGTPLALYRLLADPAEPWRAAIDWPRVHACFGDERCVPPDHPDSNHGQADAALLRRVPLAAVLRIEGERPPEEAARRYEAALARLPGAGPGRPPRLDLVLLGLGADGHTASLFPGSPALDERARWVAAPWVPAVGAHRVTLTYPALDAARRVLFLVEGARKRAALVKLLAPGPPRPDAIPAARVRPASGGVEVIADRAALGR